MEYDGKNMCDFFHISLWIFLVYVHDIYTESCEIEIVKPLPLFPVKKGDK
jgi:hypothetical protein